MTRPQSEGSKVRYLESWLPGSIRCVDGTLVVFTRPEEDDGALVAARPRKPNPSLPATVEVPDAD